MTIGVWVLGDQLQEHQQALASTPHPPANIPVILIESQDWIQRRPYHKQKLVLIWSAMRHYAQQLRQRGHPVTYVETDQFLAPLQSWAEAERLQEIRLVEPSDLTMRTLVAQLAPHLPCPLHQVQNTYFLWSSAELIPWFQGRKRWVMEDFYRQGRRRFQILMDGEQPVGGRWNFDQENRQPPKQKVSFPTPPALEQDEITEAVIRKVETLFPDHFGQIHPFRWAVTRAQALKTLDHFICHCLPHFGPLQDAMLMGEDTLWHALLSPSLNIGLLHPQEVIAAAEAAFHQGHADLASTEGFIRQILGWREYMHGLYEQLMPQGYGENNWFEHLAPLPTFYWTADTDMTCMRETLEQVQRTGYAHHIQRLMLLSNFALISGVNPQELESWFHAAFIDSFDWVMQTNVIGMGVFADGGILATKPYAASANYIHKMSDYCRNCRYNHNDKIGAAACPFNTFYWDFLLRHRQKLTQLGRMGLVLSHLQRMDSSLTEQIQVEAATWWQRQDPTMSSHLED
jgi:deoxyribodipyrimidine photolyase-related protein